MNLFRSEEPACLDAAGATIPVTKLAELAEAWWGDRLVAGLAPAHPRAEPGDPRTASASPASFWQLNL